ncbi:hypothetical protein BT96DRAFT_820517, partial [Gymnopus androsaceus JB14]
ELPDVIQVATHHFVETKLAFTWWNSMLYGWTSASNCVKIYLGSLMDPVSLPLGWMVDVSLRTEYVYDSFKILLLLEYHIMHGSHLCVSQTINQSVCFEEEMEYFNNGIRQYGQPEVDHRCDKCIEYLVYKVFTVVCDGVTVGRPCCGVPHCQGKLCSTKDAFCTEHANKASLCHATIRVTFLNRK